MTKRKYAFSWDLIGDLSNCRPNLGLTLRIEVYRLMQFCFRDVLEQRYGTEEVDAIFYEAGVLAGRHFFENAVVPRPENFNALIVKLQDLLKELGIGVLRIEASDLDTLNFTLAVSEDLDCSGLPELGYEICIYDEGFLAGILGAYTGRPFKVKEVDCWCTNERICRFEARPSTLEEKSC
ncbi:MAG: 4-vinyl reductase [Candidatus Adiutrix sp.]|jgi:predicted hydrocarbon binding protein|nr:4-vinyl reductase [Candidatus Adiutrix sp.]